jgi:hypothetical protein
MDVWMEKKKSNDNNTSLSRQQKYIQSWFMLIIALLYAGKMSSYVTGSPLSKYLWDRKVPTSYLAKQN